MMVGDRQKNRKEPSIMPIWQPVPMPCLMAGLTLAIIFTRFVFNMKIPMLAALFIMRNIWPLPNAPDRHGFDVLALTSQQCLPMTD
jgi:hypothetical protein